MQDGHHICVIRTALPTNELIPATRPREFFAGILYFQTAPSNNDSQEARTMTEVVVHGTLSPDGTLEIDQPVALPPGDVRVTIETLTSKPRRDVMEVLAEIWAERKKLGMQGRSKEQIDADIDAMRNEWEDRQRELDSAHHAQE
jgi:hypothetical protein